MAIPKMFSLARMTTSTTGTGTITLGSAATVNSVTYLTFAQAGVSDGDIVAYGIADTNASEYGYGTYTSAGTTLTRNVIRSTNLNNALNLSGSAQVFITAGGSDLLWPMAPPSNLGIAASVSGNALTIAIKDQYGNDPSDLSPVYFPVRSATATTGTPTWYAIRSATSLTISSGSTLGVVNSSVRNVTQTPFKIWIVLFDDGGTTRVGAINCSLPATNSASIYPLSAYGIASSTAEGGAGNADSALVFYTGTAVTSKAYTVIGYLSYESGLTTPGTWDANPTRIQLYDPSVPLPGRPTGGTAQVIKTDTFTSSTASNGNTVTMTIASPCVVTWTTHGLSAGQTFMFTTSGSLPTGVSPFTVYYVIATGITANTFQFSETSGGSAVNSSGSQSGTHSAFSIFDITNFNVSLTPSSATNFIKCSAVWNNIAGGSNIAATALVRNSTFITVGDAWTGFSGTSTIFRTSDAVSVNCNTMTAFDFPAQSSSTKYKIMFYLQGDTYYFNRSITSSAIPQPRLASEILLEEIMG